MIDILEIRDSTRKLIGVIDTAVSIIWVTEYYGAGTLEIYTALTPKSLQLLQIGNYVTRRGETQAAIIEGVNFKDNVQDGLMITARGRMVKSILDRRLCYSFQSTYHIKPVRLSGNVATAIQNCVRNQAGVNAAYSRQLPVTIGSNGGITKVITSGTELEADSSRQSSYKNLLTFTDGILQEYECGALIRIDPDTKLMIYDLYEGKDRTAGNTSGLLPVIFSQDFDNLISTEFDTDTTLLKTFALIGGEGEGLNRFFTTFNGDSTATGRNRREVFIDASDIQKEYDNEGTEATYTDSEYKTLLIGRAQTELKEYIITETFDGEIDVTNGKYKYGVDFNLGDKVTVQDNKLGLYVDVRITACTEVQDQNGYMLKLQYQK